jgi:UDP-glucose 4-epimerase
VHVLVTGGSGFLGAYAVRDLLAAGHQVTIVDLRESVLLAEIAGDAAGDEGPPVNRVDVTDFGAMLRLSQAVGIDAIVHLAGLLTGDCQVGPMQGLTANVTGTAVVFELARALSIDRVAWAGSISVFGHTPGQADPGNPYAPDNFYALYKTVNELQARQYFADFGVPSVGIRIATGYGYGRVGGRSSWVRDLIANPALGKPAVVRGGDTQVPWFYIEDASSAIVCALEAEPSGCRIYNTAGDLRWKHEAADFIRTLLPGADIVIEGPGEGYPVGLDDSRIRAELGWAPAYNMERGIVATVDRYRLAAGLPPLGASAEGLVSP